MILLYLYLLLYLAVPIHKLFTFNLTYLLFIISVIAIKRTHEDNVVKVKRTRLNLIGYVKRFIKIGTSFNKIITWYYRKNIENTLNYKTFLNTVPLKIIKILISAQLMKYNLLFEATYNKPKR